MSPLPKAPIRDQCSLKVARNTGCHDIEPTPGQNSLTRIFESGSFLLLYAMDMAFNDLNNCIHLQDTPISVKKEKKRCI